MAITEREARQIDEANASGRPAVVLIHGLWLLPSSWDRWSALAGEEGYAALTPSWPDARGRAVTLTLDQFKYGWANALSEEEAAQLYETFHVAGPGAPLFQAATANLNPWTEAKVDTTNPKRGPLLILDGGVDHTVPWAIANASYKKQRHNNGVTEIAKIPNRGHSLTIDSGWREVADSALAFVKRFV